VKGEYLGDEVNVVYRTNVLTPNYRAEMSRMDLFELAPDERGKLSELLNQWDDTAEADRKAAVEAVASRESQRPNEQEVKFIFDLAESWDVLEDDGVTPVPITIENLRECGYSFINWLRQLILSEIRNPPTASHS
jgi:hypothetical protein